MKRKLIIFLISLAAISGIIGLWSWQKNLYSKETLKLEILGSAEAVLGQEIEYLVKYKNNGNIRLEEPKLIFEYPEHSILEEEQSLREEKLLEDIYPGQEKTLSFKTRLLGKEGEAKVAKAWLSYRPKNLKALFESATTFTTIIKSVPLTFEFDLPSKIEAGKELTFRLNYFSNAEYPLSNLRCQVEYPSDFEFIQSSPQSLEKVEWEIGLLNKAEGGRIEIFGKISGEIGEEKIFRAKLGSWQDGEFILLKETAKGIAIVRPALRITQQINGNPEYTASPGDSLHYEIFFKNIGENSLTNMSLVASLEGKAFDFETIKSDQGDFEPGDNSIVFDYRRVPKLNFLPSLEEGKVEFWVNLKEEWEIRSPADKNPVIKNRVLSQAREEFVTKVNSKLVVSQKGYFQDGIFENSGPIPPTVGQATTYTIYWQVKNYYNDIKNAKIKAILPQGIQLTGKISPKEESGKFAFDSKSREIVWEIGDLEVGRGVLNSAPSIAFQISLTPTDAQRGQTPTLIDEAKITGEDSWTEEFLRATSPEINTTLPDDESVSEQQGVVQ